MTKLTYLEDIENPPASMEKTAETKATASLEVTKTKEVNDVKGTTRVVKRQTSIAEMFSSQSASSSSKRQRVDSATSSATVKKTTFGAAPLNSIPLNLDAFRASLTEESKELLKLEMEYMGKSWLKVLTEEIKKPYFLSLKRWLATEGLSAASPSPSTKLKIYPPPKDIYTWSQTPLGRVRVVILGQDPYHGTGQAHGLCFSVPKGITPPPSLKNIYAEIQAEYPDFEPPKHGNLSAWASNGVLLLNTCLTVRAGDAGSHSNKGWEQFTDRVVDVIDRYGGANLASPGKRAGIGKGVVFLAWGAWAQKRVARLDKKKHLILASAHPSPLSAYRGFFGNNHFKAANEWLEEKYGKDGMVDWCQLD